MSVQQIKINSSTRLVFCLCRKKAYNVICVRNFSPRKAACYDTLVLYISKKRRSSVRFARLALHRKPA